MHILLTNSFLTGRSGSEEVVRDYAGYFLRQGHRVSVYTPVISEETRDHYRAVGADVASDLAAFSDPPDLIHGQHITAFLPAMIRFPGRPVVQWIHGTFGSWDMTVTHPDVVHYIAVDSYRAGRVTADGVDPSRVTIVPNTIDVDRFALQPLEATVRRALYISKGGDDLDAVARACAATGWTLEVVGRGVGREVHDLEAVIARNTLVISTARCAMEAVAMGRAVLIADWRCLGDQVTLANWGPYRAGNLDLPATWRPFSEDGLAVELARIDLAEGPLLARAVRDVLRVDHEAAKVESLYREIVARHRPTPGVEDWPRDLLRFLAGSVKFRPDWRPTEEDRIGARRGIAPQDRRGTEGVGVGLLEFDPER